MRKRQSHQQKMNRPVGRNDKAQQKVRLHEKVKTAKGRKISSTRWLDRQLNDPYVKRALRAGYRSRAAYKLLEINDRFRLLQVGHCVLDLGCAPGSWLQIATRRTKADQGRGFVLGIDMLDVEPIRGAHILKMDFLDPNAPHMIEEYIRTHYEKPDYSKDGIDVILSDMAANMTGHRQTDHLRIIGLAEAVTDFAFICLKPGGSLCLKLLQGGAQKDLLTLLKTNFKRVAHMKPKASRKESSELYLVAMDFKGKA